MTTLPCYFQRATAFLALVLCVLAPGRASGDTPFLRIEAGGHTAAVRKILFAKDGTQLISVGKDKAVRIWDVASGRQLRTLRSFIGPDQTGEIYAAALDSGEHLLAVGGNDLINQNQWVGEMPLGRNGCGIRLFDLASGKLLRVLSDHAASINALAFSHKGLLASGSADKNVILWDPQTGNLLHKCPQGAYVSDVTFSPDGQQVASAGYDGTVCLWSVETGKLVKRLNCGAAATCLAWSPGGEMLAIGTRQRRILLWNPVSGVQQPALTQADDPTSLAFNRDGHLLLSGSGEHPENEDLKVRVWSIPDGNLRNTFDQHTGTIYSVAFAPDGQTVASADLAGRILLWDAASGAVKHRLRSTGSSLFAVAWAPDGKRLAWGRTMGTSQNPAPLEQVFDLIGLQPLPNAQPANDWQAAQMQREGRTLTISPEHRTVNISGAKPISVRDPNDRFLCATFVSKNEVAVGSLFGLSLYDISGVPKLMRQFVGHDGEVLALAPSPDGTYLASASADQTVRIWNLHENGRLVGKTDNAVQPLLSIFQGSDGEWVAWTPPGYYGSSAAGDDIIGWQVNRGRDQVADFYRAVQFHTQYYRPDVLRHVLETASVGKALALANQEKGKPQVEPPVDVIVQIPRLPHVEIVAIDPADPQADGSFITDKTDVRVRVRISNAAPNTVALRLAVSTRLISEDRVRDMRIVEATARPDEVTLRVQLRVGVLNLIRVVGSNDAGESSPGEARVLCRAAAVTAPLPVLYMLAVGIHVFSDGNLNGLEYTVRDAEDVASFYRGQKGKLFSNVVVKLLTDRQATKQSILDALTAIRKQSKPNDLFIFFVASHGVSWGDPQSGGEHFYIATYDTISNSSHVAQTSLSGEALLENLQQMNATVLLILDACHSGSIKLEHSFTDLLHSARQVVFTFTACRPEELSYEDPSWQHGAFTYELLAALERPQTRGPDGKKSMYAVSQYVRDTVAQIVHEKLQQNQTPTFYPSPLADDRLPIAATP